MNRRFSKKWLLLIAAFCWLTVYFTTAYNQNKTTASCVIPVDFEDSPKRIVSLAPNITEILFSLALGEKIVAVSSDSDYPSEARGKKHIGTFWRPLTETIIACEPDLVITLWFEQQKAAADTLRRLGYPVLTLKIETIAELLSAIEKIGTATSRAERANEVTSNIKKALLELKSRYSGSARKVKTLWVIQTEPLRVAGRGTFVNEIIELAGGENAVGPTIQKYPSIGSEELLGCEAEVIIQSSMDAGDLAIQQKTAENFWSKWDRLAAVKNKRIYVVDSDSLLRLGPRLVQGVEIIAGYLHSNRKAVSAAGQGQ